MKKRLKKKLAKRENYTNYRDYRLYLQSIQIISLLGDLFYNKKAHIAIDIKFSDKNIPSIVTYRIILVEGEEKASIFVMSSKAKSDTPVIQFCTIFNALVYNMRQLGQTDKEVYVTLKEKEKKYEKEYEI